MSAPTTTRFAARYGSDLDVTQPLRIVTAPAAARHSAAPRPRRSPGRIVAAALSAVLLLALIAAAAFLLGGQNVARSTAVATPAALPAAVPAAAPVPTTGSPVVEEPGPALVDDNGDAVAPGIATVVQDVYSALSGDDLDPVRRAYSAAGSDDWFTSSSHLEKASVRAKVLRTLRATPTRADDGYRYSSGSYTVRLGQGDQYAEPGLLTIDGPWTAAPTQEESESVSAPAGESSVTTSSGSGCIAGTHPSTAGGLPCIDTATGTEVGPDGTAGVHGLRPCPPGTTIPSDPDEPTRNASTGEICAVV